MPQGSRQSARLSYAQRPHLGLDATPDEPSDRRLDLMADVSLPARFHWDGKPMQSRQPTACPRPLSYGRCWRRRASPGATKTFAAAVPTACRKSPKPGRRGTDVDHPPTQLPTFGHLTLRPARELNSGCTRVVASGDAPFLTPPRGCLGRGTAHHIKLMKKKQNRHCGEVRAMSAHRKIA
jgi:hypothetical protein